MYTCIIFHTRTDIKKNSYYLNGDYDDMDKHLDLVISNVITWSCPNFHGGMHIQQSTSTITCYILWFYAVTFTRTDLKFNAEFTISVLEGLADVFQ